MSCVFENEVDNSPSKMTESEIYIMKYRWRRKQYKRVSNSSIVFGPRDSVKYFWEKMTCKALPQNNDSLNKKNKCRSMYNTFKNILTFYKK